MADNVAVTAGTGTTIAADEVSDGTLGSVKVQFVKIMDGTLDGTTKAAVGAGGIKVDPTSSVAMNTGTRSATTQRVTIATDDSVAVTIASVPSHAVTNAGTFAVQDSRFVTEDAAAASDPVGPQMMAVRRDTLSASEVTADGDNIAIKATNKGQMHVYAQIDSTQMSALGQTTMSASAPVVIASDQSPVSIVPKPSATANGSTSSRVNSAGSTNATSLKASAGNIAEIDVFNNNTYAVFLKLYNKASAPTVGTDVPVWTIPIPAGGGFSKSFPRGKSFATGIAYAITKLQADSDTTAVLAGDLTGSIDWI